MRQTSRVSIRLRTPPVLNPHPPYGLFVDPHRGRHAWWAVDGRVVLGVLSALAGVAAALNIVAH